MGERGDNEKAELLAQVLGTVGALQHREGDEVELTLQDQQQLGSCAPLRQVILQRLNE